MNRPKRINKSFVSAGIYDPNTAFKQQNQGYGTQQQQQRQQFQGQQTPQAQRPQVRPQVVQPPTLIPENETGKQANVPLAQSENMQNAAEMVEPAVPQIPTAMDTSITNETSLDNSGLVDENGKVKFKKIFGMRKKASVRAKEKRIRQNRRLRKTIIPKNALMALHEVKGLTISEFSVSSNPSGGFTATVIVNAKQYEGVGNSKAAAKNCVSEKALRDYIIEKMRQNPRTNKNGTISTAGSVCNDEIMDASGEKSGTSDSVADKEDDADDVPMVNLASFALYKLFSEWESEGYVVPEMHPARGNTSDNEGAEAVTKEPKKAPKRSELPPNWQAMHPASLLCVVSFSNLLFILVGSGRMLKVIMRPGITYIDKGRVGDKQNDMQTMAVVVDDCEFVAVGRSKKAARHNVAAAACNALFSTQFIKSEPVDDL